MDKIKDGIISGSKWAIGFFTNYYVSLIILAFLMLVIYPFLMKQNADVLQSKSYMQFIFMGVPIIILLAFIFKNASIMSGSMTDSIMPILKIIGAIALIAGISYVVSNLKSTSDSDSIATIMFFVNAVIGLMLLFGLILVGRAMKVVAYSLEGWIGVIARIVFFIPCMLSDLFNYTLGQFAKSPFVVYVLLAIEVGLLLAYIYLPKLLAKYTQKSVYKVMKEPALLKTETIVSSLENVLIKEGNPPIPSTGSTWNTCTLSMWIYIVGMPKNQYPYNEEARIFELTTSHPKLVYDGRTNVCRVYYENSGVSSMEFKIALQKWAHFVIVYDTDNIDVFVDNELIQSVPRTSGMVTTTVKDNFVIGQENGLMGSVCNIVHSKQAVSKFQISYMYDMNKHSNPPIA
jgi:hypothetical protein